MIQLHLELDLNRIDNEDFEILQKYGSVETAISRDILAPGDITLHALNYAILRMFGWQNGHLHCFTLPFEVFEKLTDDRFMTWADLIGVYFRPNTEDFEDIYWDDDYSGNQSIKTWMRRKYTGPYRYGGKIEHYINGQLNIRNTIAHYPKLTVHELKPGTVEWKEPYTVDITKATMDQARHSRLDFLSDELVERLLLVEVLAAQGNEIKDPDTVRKYAAQSLAERNAENAVSSYPGRKFSTRAQEQAYLSRYDIPVLPVTDCLIYKYDFGDGWMVYIYCDDAFYHTEKDGWKHTSKDSCEATEADLNEVLITHRPLCLKKDGIELVDDAGGIDGFCQMLRTLYEPEEDEYEDEDEDDDEPSEQEEMWDWANMMGWTGRKISPQKTL